MNGEKVNVGSGFQIGQVFALCIIFFVLTCDFHCFLIDLTDLIAITEQPRYHLRSASGLKLKYPSLKLKKT